VDGSSPGGVPELLTEFLGDCSEIVELRRQVSRLLTRPGIGGRLPPILLLGETGTGKGLLARCIHRASSRRERPFVDVDCAAIPETLLEAELFGFERGTFTDARQAKAGLFQSAHLGVVFLDEVGLIPRPLQAKLLKVVEQREVRRLGGTRSTPLDVCIISATNEELVTATAEGRFREDLYHRLSAVTLHLPPLRERGSDILLLAERFIARACLEYGLPQKRLSPGARDAIMDYRWPGNLRELLNVADRVTLLSDEPVITTERLDLPSGGGRRAGPPTVRASLALLERAQLLEALEGADWKLSAAASRLGVPRNTLRYRMVKLGIALARGRQQPPVVPAGAPAAVASPLQGREELGPRRVIALRLALGALPEETSSAPRVIDRLAARLRRFGGRTNVENTGQLSAVFGLDPGEDAAGRAALAALSIRDSVPGMARGGAVARLAIHAETVLASVRDGVTTIVAPDTDRLDSHLARILAVSEPGTITVSDVAAHRLERRFALAPMANTDFLHRLVGPRPEGDGRGRALTPFVGREEKVDVLTRLFVEVERGHGQVVGIVGEPGIGKSRLLAEFRARLAGRRHVWRQGRYLPDGGALPFQPAIGILREAFGLDANDSPEAAARKVHGAVAVLGLDPEQAGPLILAFLGDRDAGQRLRTVPPGELKSQIFEALVRLAIERSQQDPLVLAIEDLQWGPPVAEEFLRALVGVVSGAPILLLCTYRPEHQPTWLGRSYVTQLALQPLSREDSVAIVRGHLGSHEVSERLEARLLDRGEGNPFFLEELAVASSQHLVTESAVPATIEAVIVARMESLPDDLSRVLQVVAVAGQEVPLRVLQEAIGGPPADLGSRLEHLVRLEFIRPVLRGGERAYLFKHTLTRHVIYQSLVAGVRETLHRTLAEVLERVHADHPVVEQLAYHYARGRLPGRAVEYLRHAAVRAGRRHAPGLAVTMLRDALVQARRLPVGAEREGIILDLATRLTQPLALLGRLAEARDELTLHRHRITGVDDASVVGRFWAALGSVYGRLGDQRQGEAHLDLALQYAVRSGDSKTLARAHQMLSQSRFWAGDFSRGIWHGLESASLYERRAEPWRVGRSMVFVALQQAALGDLAQAAISAGRVQELAQEADDALLQSAGHICRAVVAAMSGKSEEAIAAGLLAVQKAHGPSSRAYALSFLGGAYLEADDAVNAIASLQQASAGLNEFGFARQRALASAWLGEALLLQGEVDGSEAVAEEAVAQVGRMGSPFIVAWSERTLGRVAQARGRLDEADMRLGRAQDSFARLSARYETARTMLARASVAWAAGRRPAADNLLAAASPAFVEMQIPAYLQGARTLGRRFAGAALGL
jgi:transcriptional regulator with AAA-type ATPase domain/tetratricopeptide (TPR) repeat protein